MNSANMPSYGAWTSSMIGGGGWIQNVIFTSNPQVLYAWVDVGGFYRSDNAGQNWHMLHGNLPNITGANEVRGVVADPRNAFHILVACGNESAPKPPKLGIFKSTDGGVTFTQTLTTRFAGNARYRQDGFILVRNPQNPDVLLAGSLGAGMWRSTDGGDSWKLSGSNTEGINFTDIKFDRTNALKAYACAQTMPSLAGGFYASIDAGVTWTMQGSTSPAEIAQDPLLSPSRFYGTFNGASSNVSFSDNCGVTWTPTLGIPSSTTYRAIAAGPNFTVVSGLNANFYTLPSGQTTWQPVQGNHVDYRGWTWSTPRKMFGLNVSSISIDPLNSSHWFITDAFGAYQTTDSGADWSLALDGIEATVIQTLCQDPSNPGRVHLGMADNAYLKSSDCGTSFQSSWIHLIYNVKDVELSPSLPSHVYMACGKDDESNQIYYSNDSGATWTHSPMTGLPTSCFNTIAVSPTDSNECFLAVAGKIAPGAGGPYHSTDGGLTWTWLGEGLPAGSWFFNSSMWIPGRQIATGPGTGAGCSVAIVRGYASSVYTLNRATMKWEAAASPAIPRAIVADSSQPGAWIISATDGIHRLGNGKLSTVWSGSEVTNVTADMVTPGRFAASSIGGILLSTDHGQNWTMLDAALPEKQAYNALAFAGNRLVVGSGGSGVFHINLASGTAVDNRNAGSTTNP